MNSMKLLNIKQLNYIFMLII